MKASEHYQARLADFRQQQARAERRFRTLGNLRVLVLLIAIGIAGAAFGPGWISPWWLLAPVAASIALVVAHDRVEQERSHAGRGIAYYERALGGLSNQWIGMGNQGERFRDPKHVYADDLDLFGRGSLFEMLSTARTGAGESALASWLLAPSDREPVIARQQAVAELRDRVDLREELALMGEDIRAAVDAGGPARWGLQPAAGFFRGARLAAFALSAAAVITLGLWIAHIAPLTVFLVVLLAEIAFSMAIRAPMERVIEGVATPGKELGLLMLLLERVEREQFSTPALVALKRSLETRAAPHRSGSSAWES